MKSRKFSIIAIVFAFVLGISMVGVGVAAATGLISCSNQVTSVVTVVTNPKLVLSTDYAATTATAGVPYEFHVQLQNPSATVSFAGVGVDLVAYDNSDSNIASSDVTLKYWDGTAWQTWVLSDSGSTLTGRFGPSGGFTVGPSYDVTTLFEVTYNTVGSYQFTIEATN